MVEICVLWSLYEFVHTVMLPGVILPDYQVMC
jgi:hypothetical protein